MSNVISLDRHRRMRPNTGYFAACGCPPEGETFIPVAQMADDGFMHVIALVCPECEKSVPIHGGVFSTSD